MAHPGSHRILLGMTLVLAVAVLGACGSCADEDDPVPPTPDGPVWFDDLAQPRPIDLTDDEQQAMVDLVRALLRKEPAAADALSTRLQTDREPRGVFVTVSDGQSAGRSMIGTARGLAAAARNATAGLLPTLDHDETAWLKIDIVREIVFAGLADLDRPLSGERSLQGLAFEGESAIAFLPDELVAYTLLDRNQIVRKSNINRRLGRESKEADQFAGYCAADATTVYRFTTSAFFSAGDDVVRMYRGHRLMEEPTTDDLMTASRRGGDYLAAAVRPDGSFVYVYKPKTDEVSDTYNILRHAGTLFSMMELYEHTKDPTLLDAARRAVTYLVGEVARYEIDDERVACVVENSYVKLGANGLSILALAKYTEVTGDSQHLPLLIEMGRWIQGMQNDDGSFRHKLTYPDLETTDFVSSYYPGEAIFGLTRLYELDPQDRWLDTAENAARYLIHVRDKDVADDALQHDHWLLYGLNELYRRRPDAAYLNHAMRIADAIVNAQNRRPPFPDWYGSYYKPPRSTPTATRSEGLLAAYRLAEYAGKPQDIREKILDAAKAGIAFQLQMQFGPESALYLKDPQRVQGGFHKSLTDYSIRIDYVQHSLSSLLALYEILKEREGPRPANQ